MKLAPGQTCCETLFNIISLLALSNQVCFTQNIGVMHKVCWALQDKKELDRQTNFTLIIFVVIFVLMLQKLNQKKDSVNSQVLYNWL